MIFCSVESYLNFQKKQNENMYFINVFFCPSSVSPNHCSKIFCLFVCLSDHPHLLDVCPSSSCLSCASSGQPHSMVIDLSSSPSSSSSPARPRWTRMSFLIFSYPCSSSYLSFCVLRLSVISSARLSFLLSIIPRSIWPDPDLWMSNPCLS